MQDLAKTVRAQRKQLGIPQWRLALETGLSDITVVRVESGKPVEFTTVYKLRQFFGDVIELPEIRPPWNRD